MLIHIVCWKYKPGTDAASRDEHRAKLRDLPSLIPNILSFDVGEDVLHLERSFDTGLVARFSNRDALDIYTDHAEHQAVVAFGRKIAEKVVSVDFFTD
ncbi:MAG: Dabb family protein [Pyrinomonadaceae bacterium]